jgi:hypothetical protein
MTHPALVNPFYSVAQRPLPATGSAAAPIPRHGEAAAAPHFSLPPQEPADAPLVACGCLAGSHGTPAQERPCIRPRCGCDAGSCRGSSVCDPPFHELLEAFVVDEHERQLVEMLRVIFGVNT